MMSARRIAAAILSTIFLATTQSRAVEPVKSGADLMLVFDASGSMWGQVKKEAKITIARRVLKDVLSHVPADSGVGLVAYGHRSKTDCADIETVIAPGSKDRAALLKAVEGIQPKGMTPITASVQKVFEQLRGRETASTVVLISDGLETCKGDPCKAVKEAKAAGIKFVLHVVGFDMGKNDVSQLECAAQAGDGLYLTADDADQLGKALEQAVAMTPETPAGKLSIKTTADGKLVDTTVTVMKAEGDEEINRQRTYASPETNPRVIPLPDGKYDVAVQAVTISGNPVQRFTDIEIRDGATVEKTVDFGTGTLRVKVTRNGKLSDATVQVHTRGVGAAVASGRTYTEPTHNPMEARVPAGTYDVTIGSVEIAGRPTHEWKNVQIGGSEPVELSFEFASTVIRVGATSGGKLIDAVVSITRPDSKTAEAQGRTYVSPNSNPKSFEVAPGTYRVKVSPVKPPGLDPVTFDVKLDPADTVERTIDFPVKEK